MMNPAETETIFPASLRASPHSKIPVITLTRDDWELLARMHAAARQKLPDLTLDSVLSALITETLRHLRANPTHSLTDSLTH